MTVEPTVYTGGHCGCWNCILGAMVQHTSAVRTVGFHFLKSHTKGLLLLFLHPQCLWFSAGRVSHRFLPHLPFLENPITVPEQMVLTPLLLPHKPPMSSSTAAWLTL